MFGDPLYTLRLQQVVTVSDVSIFKFVRVCPDEHDRKK